MAIIVKHKEKSFHSVFGDSIAGIFLEPGEESEDLTGRDCRGIISELKKPIPMLEMVEGSLDIWGYEGNVTSTEILDILALSSRSAKEVFITNLGDGDIQVNFNGDTSGGIRLEKGQAYNNEFEIPVREIKITLASGTSADYRIAIE